METHMLDQRRRFIAALLSGHWSMSELCTRFGVSRPTGYKWEARAEAAGSPRLPDRSHAPHDCPHRLAPRLDERLLAARREYGWGAKKLRQVLRAPRRGRRGRRAARSTICSPGIIYCVASDAAPTWTHPGHAPLVTTQPNQVWPADFKGQFKTGDGQYRYPLTVTDHFSRTLLVCRGLASVHAGRA